MQKQIKNIAWVGLGAMGRRMARRLLDAGYAVTVHNRSPEAADELVARQEPAPRVRETVTVEATRTRPTRRSSAEVELATEQCLGRKGGK